MTAFIVGAAGQDGRLLTQYLESRGEHVHGIVRDGSLDVLDAKAVALAMQDEKPQSLYYLAAVHQSAQEPTVEQTDLMARSLAVNVLGWINCLEAARLHVPSCRLLYCASSHVFGVPGDRVQNELTSFAPNSIYAISKVAGIHAARLYRTQHGLFASCAILYNHESALRRPQFLSKKVALAVAAIQRGSADKLVLGDLDACVDWGYAGDYVAAMAAIVGASEPNDYVVASGEARSVRDFVSTAFRLAGLDWKAHVEVKTSTIVRQPVTLVGDSSRLRRATGWQPKVGFEAMVRLLLEAEGVKVVAS